MTNSQSWIWDKGMSQELAVGVPTGLFTYMRNASSLLFAWGVIYVYIYIQRTLNFPYRWLSLFAQRRNIRLQENTTLPYYKKNNIMYPSKSSSKWCTKTIVVFTSIYHIYPIRFHPPSPGTGFLRIGQRSSFAGDLWFDIPGTKLGDGRWKQSRWSNGM